MVEIPSIECKGHRSLGQGPKQRSEGILASWGVLEILGGGHPGAEA